MAAESLRPADRATAARGLYAITPDRPAGERLLADVEAALQGGCRWLQYRDKLSDKPEQVRRARALRALTRRYGARLLINDDLLLCQLVEADGVHLGQDDGDLALARALLGPDKWIGASCYADLALAGRAIAAGADYVAFGAVHPSPTKPEAVRAAPSLFAAARVFAETSPSTVKFPPVVCAIGGITLANAAPLIAAGADLLAVITDLFEAPDIAARARQYHHLFEETAS